MSTGQPDSKASSTSALLICGAVAGPLFTVVALIEMLVRPGFDLRRHDLSLLSNGDGGWIQIANFVVAGLLTIVGAIGMKRVLRAGRGRTWAPLLIGIYGLGYIGAGMFLADPMNGFPPGTPSGPPASASWHSWMHLISGSLGFLALIAACFVFASRFASLGLRAWVVCSAAAGIVVTVAVVGISSGSQQPIVIIGFFTAATVGWAWLSAVSIHLVQQFRRSDPSRLPE
jgi:hypothetical protein